MLENEYSARFGLFFLNTIRRKSFMVNSILSEFSKNFIHNHKYKILSSDKMLV